MSITEIVRARSRNILVSAKNIFRSFGLVERLVLFVLLLAIIISAAGMIRQRVISRVSNPDFGGVMIEGDVGRPQSLSPLFAESDSERDVANLLYAGLLKYDEKHEIIGDLVDKWSVSADGKTYDFTLKNNIFWSNGQPVTVEDIFYTITLTKNNDYNGPMRALFSDVEGSKKSNREFELKLKKPYAPFINSLTMKILPSFVWEKVMPQNVANSDLNSKPVVSGPFVIDQMVRSGAGIDQISFLPNEKYYGSRPYLASFVLKFFEKETGLSEKIRSQEVMAGVIYNQKNIPGRFTRVASFKIKLPQYVALFFNQKKNPVLAEKAVRDAIAKVINKDEIVRDIYASNAEKINSPVLPGYLGYEKQEEVFAPDEARTTLQQAGWVMNGKVLEKQGKKLTLTITCMEDDLYQQVAKKIAANLSEIGIEAQIVTVSQKSIPQEIIRLKNYEVLLFGENIGADPDIFDFWHSSQIENGYNLALFENAEADKLLEEARQATDVNLRINDYKRFQEIITSKTPAVFLYRPYATYVISRKVYGLKIPTQFNYVSERFDNIDKWYIKTK